MKEVSIIAIVIDKEDVKSMPATNSVETVAVKIASPPSVVLSASVLSRYIDLKSREKVLKVDIDVLNKGIKAVMKEKDLARFEDGQFIATYSTSCKAVPDEEKMIARLKELGFTEAIKIKEVVDAEVVESLMYHGKITAAEMADCVSEGPPVATLRVTRKKEKKGT